MKKVCARVYHFAAQRRERLHNAGNNLRNCLHDFNYDRRQILNERHEKLNARHNDLVDVADQRVYNAAYDLRDRLNDRRYNLRQCLYERDKKINARLNDKQVCSPVSAVIMPSMICGIASTIVVMISGRAVINAVRRSIPA